MALSRDIAVGTGDVGKPFAVFGKDEGVNALRRNNPSYPSIIFSKTGLDSATDEVSVIIFIRYFEAVE